MNGRRRFSRDEAVRFRICHGKKFLFFLAKKITRWDQGTWRWFLRSGIPCWAPSPHLQMEEKEFSRYNSTHQWFWYLWSLPMPRFCHPQEKRRIWPDSHQTPVIGVLNAIRIPPWCAAEENCHQSNCITQKRRGGLALTWANPVNKVKSRNLHVRLRNLFQVRTMVTHVIDGKTSTMLPSPFSVGRPTRLLDSHTEEMTLASEEKRGALAAYKACPTKQNLQALRAARSKHHTKNLIWTKSVLFYKFGAKKGHTTVKSRAKIVNAALALEFTTPCKLPWKCGIYHLCLSFPTSFDFLHHICPGVNFCKSNFSCSESSADRQEVCKRLLA